MASSEKELEGVLLEVGNRLLAPPSAVDDLLPLLDQAETSLSRVEQSPSPSMSVALQPAMRGLTSKELLGHSDVDVKIAVASCISEITRITAPEAPYDDDLMKEIFQMIVESFENLDDMQNHSYAKRVSILETVAKVRSCVVMLDLECDDLILEMFHHFLTKIRDSHPGNVFSSMELIMTVILEESEDISMDLLSCLLTSVKKDSKDTFPIARRLAEKVISNCALKLQPCLREAIQSLGSPLDNYCEIVSLVCQDSDQLVHSGLNLSGKSLADDSKLSVRTVSDELPKDSGKLESEVACSEDIGNAADKSPKSAMSNGTVQTENGDSSVEPPLPHEKIEHSDHSTLAKHTIIAGIETDKVDTALDQGTKEAGGHKVNSGMQSSEVTEPSRIDTNKEALESLISSKDSSREINRLQSEVATGKEAEATALDAHTTITELQAPSEKSPNDNASTISSAPSKKSPDACCPKRGRPSGSKGFLKKGRINAGVPASQSRTGKSLVNEHTKNEEVPSVDISSKKEDVGIRDLDPKALGTSVKKRPLRNVDNEENPLTDSPAKMDLDVTCGSEGKLHGSPGIKPQMEKASGGEFSGKREASKPKQKGRVSAENNAVGEPNLKENVSSHKTIAKASQGENHAVETPKMMSRKKRARETEISESPRIALKYDNSLVGAKIRVWWPDDEQFYPGVVDSYDAVSMRHKVLYADGDEEDLLLKNEVFEFLKGDKEEVEDQGDSTPVAASEMSRKKAKTSDSSSKKSKVATSSKGTRGSSAARGSGGRAESAGKHGGDATKLISGQSSSSSRSKSGNKVDDSTPGGSRPKGKASNRSSFGSPKAGSIAKAEVSKKPTDASASTPTKSMDGMPKSGSKAKGDVAKSSTKSRDNDAKNSSKSKKDGKFKAGQVLSSGTTIKSGRPDANGTVKGKTGKRTQK